MTEIATDAAKVQSVPVQVPKPYAQGHTLTEAEAEALNSYFSNRVTSGVAAKVKEIVGERKYADLSPGEQETLNRQVQALVDEFAKDYQFGSRRGGGRTADPVEAEAKNIARELVRNALKAKGTNLTNVPFKKISELANQVLSDNDKGTKIRKQAAEVVKRRQAMAELGEGISL